MSNVKINKSIVKNIKNIDEFEVDLNGGTAYIIGGNTQGKTTFIRFLFDRLSKGKTNDNSVLKDKSAEGVSEIIMSDGCGFKYIITPDGKEKLIYITDGIEIKATKEIINKYIAKPFDIDKFLQMHPKEKVNYLTKTLGIDISEINEMLKNAISERRVFNNMMKEKEAVFVSKKLITGEKKDIDALLAKRQKLINEHNANVLIIEKENETIRKEYEKKKSELINKMLEYNAKVEALANKKEDITKCIDILTNLNDNNLHSTIKHLVSYRDSIVVPEKKTLAQLEAYIGEPQLKEIPKLDLSAIDKEIEDARRYNEQFNANDEYYRAKEEYEEAVKLYQQSDRRVKQLEAQIKNELNKINLPPDITIVDGENIYYNGFPVDKEHLSTSELYIVALMLGSITLKDLKVMHFDCSALDKISMQKVLKYAKDNDLQLLIERPDFDGGELRFELVEE